MSEADPLQHAGELVWPQLADLPDRLRLACAFDPVRLADDMDRLASVDWTPHFIPDNYRGEWSVLPLRFERGAVHPILRAATHPGITKWEDSELLAVCPYLRAVLASFACPIASVRLMRLSAGSVIHEHSDGDLAAEYGIARLHVPVLTNADVDFRLNGTRVTMRAGETWYLRLADRHSVANRGQSDRIHLVIDATVNPWLADRLLSAAAVAGVAAAEA